MTNVECSDTSDLRDDGLRVKFPMELAIWDQAVPVFADDMGITMEEMTGLAIKALAIQMIKATSDDGCPRGVGAGT